MARIGDLMVNLVNVYALGESYNLRIKISWSSWSRVHSRLISRSRSALISRLVNIALNSMLVSPLVSVIY